MSDSGLIAWFERLIFGHRKIVFVLFGLITVLLAYSAATQLRIDTAFSKQLPTGHEYMQTFNEYYDRFGGANRVLVALIAKDGDMFDPEFFETLKNATDAVFFIPGVDRPKVQSIFTP
ncbi:MAG: RND family transporter, partial [Gammaproteobacteria bacterium]